MLRFRYWIKNFFGFTRAQVNGSLVLLLIIVLALFSEPLWHWWASRQPYDFSTDHALLDSLVAHWPEKSHPEVNESHNATLKRFKFNPNLASMEELVSLGFSSSMAQRIVRYREKGGNFRVKSDLLKIYGIDSSFYLKLSALIELPEKVVLPKKTQSPRAVFEPKSLSPKIEHFDLNTADTSQLKRIRGIGEKLSLRIVKYRDALGGFITPDQLREVYGLDSVVIGRLREQASVQNDFRPEQIDLNTSTEKEIAAHPYLSKAARSIVSYRFQHGPFTKVEDIRNIGSLDEKLVNKIMPYITVN
jgi:DNA uptake protein ComE-like DNA-binding protein